MDSLQASRITRGTKGKTNEEIVENARRILYGHDPDEAFSGAEIGQISAALGVARIVLRVQQERENTKPLTLDELREMDGEPVWIAPKKEGGKITARWMLVSAHSTEVDLYLFQPNSGIAQGYTGKSYGTAWLAYRHKPREEDR